MFDALKRHWDAQKQQPIMALFEAKNRAEQFSVQADDLLLDYSKTRIDAIARKGLLDLAQARGLEERRLDMFQGAALNETEGRAVLHSALRNLDGPDVFVNGHNVMPDVQEALQRMTHFSEDLRRGRFQGPGGPITDIVNIGIGGSDLGPAMACLALAPYHDGPKCHFVSNVDGAHLHDILQNLDPTRSLFIIASKTFTTIETMTNAQTAKAWLAQHVTDPGAQFVALSTAQEKTKAFGIAAERVFGFADWVGGRYSLWGPIGLSLMLAIGPNAFRDFLRGAQSMDRHFCTAALSQNMPVMLALVGLWHHQVCGFATRAVLPYEQRLSRLPAYLQQLEMESNGKRVDMNGQDLPYPSGPVVWGEPGTNGQHAFYQLIHQGTAVVPCEFMVAREGHEASLDTHHRLLIANCLAQSEALMRGRTLEQARQLMIAQGLSGDELERQARHRVFPGNRPSTTLIYSRLSPFVLGQIIALYEHRVFAEGVILGINSFDQWGVELGKELARDMEQLLSGAASAADKDGSTQRLLDYIRTAQS